MRSIGGFSFSSNMLPHVKLMMSTKLVDSEASPLRANSEAILDFISSINDGAKVIPLYPDGDE